ncbi:MAG: PIN domain nuclease [Candidatus Angelobacter sp. Gp1-AA117]|nr:MAG: PIN domain nuclease [Candidatus Angelobacter sp. Gp1-AA117]
MRLLLDTHALLWWLTDDSSLSTIARKSIGKAGNTILMSAVSAWEMAIKFRSGKLPGVADLISDFSGHLHTERFEQLLISADHSIRAGLLPGPHKDPFDRMLIAQAQAENVPIISNDAAFDQYGVRRIW